MTEADVIAMGRDAFSMILLLGGPVLGAAVTVGTGISRVQAVTQVHEQTLTFLPKLVVVGGTFVLASGWMLEQMVDYATDSFEQIRTIDSE